MRGSRNIRQGGGVGGGGGGGGGEVQVSLTKKKALTTFFFFLVLCLFYRSQMVNFKEIYHFSRFQHFPGGGGSNFFQGSPIAYSL